MSRLIDADALLKQIDIDAEGDEGYYGDTWLFIDTIKAMPTIEPERKTGRWIRHIRTDLGPKLNDIIECSECRIAFQTENMFRRSFCPNCGSYNGGKSDV